MVWGEGDYSRGFLLTLRGIGEFKSVNVRMCEGGVGFGSLGRGGISEVA